MILFQVEEKIDISNYDTYQQRVFGFLAERLFNVWTTYQSSAKGLKIEEIKIVNIEGENIFLKALGMLKRKYF